MWFFIGKIKAHKYSSIVYNNVFLDKLLFIYFKHLWENLRSTGKIA